MQASLNKDQMSSLFAQFACPKPGFSDCFEWKKFVEQLEAACGMRL